MRNIKTPGAKRLGLLKSQGHLAECVVREVVLNSGISTGRLWANIKMNRLKSSLQCERYGMSDSPQGLPCPPHAPLPSPQPPPPHQGSGGM